MLDTILDYNKKFVEDKKYESYITSKYPNKKLAILTCMDTRLTELLPAALGLKNGDAKMIKNAGGIINHPYGSVMRSLLVGILELGIKDIMVIGHTDCGVQNMDGKKMVEKLKARGIPAEHIEIICNSNIKLEQWLSGFTCVRESVTETTEMLRRHPLMPRDVSIRGFIMDSTTGELKEV